MVSSHRSRLPTFLLAFIMLALGACAEASSPRKAFLDDIEAKIASGHSHKDITKAIQSYALKGQEDPFALPGETLDLENWGREEQAFEQIYEDFVKDIQNRRCDRVQSFLQDEQFTLRLNEASVRAIFREEGICVERSPEQAAALYHEILKDGWLDAAIAARLGALYLKGEGVDQNLRQAEKHFKKAVLWQAPKIWREEYLTPGYKFRASLAFRLWGQTQYEMDVGFAELETGPWEVPEPLSRALSETLALKTEDGARIIEMAENLLNGANGFKQDVPAAFTWIKAAAEFGNREAKYRAALWGMDISLCAEFSDDCDFWIRQFRQDMELAAFEGHKGAIRNMIVYYAGAPDIAGADWGLYQYCRIGEVHDAPCDSVTLETATASLSSTHKRIIEAWITDGNISSIAHYLPGD
jgi:TPR repeat protein